MNSEEKKILEAEIDRGLLGKQKLIINDLGITFKDNHLSFDQIKSLRYGGKSYKGPTDFIFEFLTNENKIVRIMFPSFTFCIINGERVMCDELNKIVTNLLWKYYTSKFVNQMIQKLNKKRAL